VAGWLPSPSLHYWNSLQFLYFSFWQPQRKCFSPDRGKKTNNKSGSDKMSEPAAQVKMEVDSQPPPPPPDTPATATTAGTAGAASLAPTGAQPMIVNTPQEMDEEEKESIEDLLNSLEDFVPAVRSLPPPQIHIKSFSLFAKSLVSLLRFQTK
jgi:hypothetical protein